MIHGFLKWAGPTVVIFTGACIGLIATIAQGFPDTRPWAERLFYQWWPVVTAPWSLSASGAVICAYVWALIWTAGAPRVPQVTSPTFDPEQHLREEMAREKNRKFARAMMGTEGDAGNSTAEPHFGQAILKGVMDTSRQAFAGTEEHPLQAAVKTKAQLMRDRLETRNHTYSLPLYDTPRTTSYLAAMWDAEERGHFYDDYHRSTFMPLGKGAPRDLPGNTIAELQQNVIEYKESRRLANLRHRKAEERRALIAKGRDVVVRWRKSDRSLPFEIFASQDRDYLDVQPYLGDEYQAERSRRGRTAVLGAQDIEDYYAGQLLRELDRLADVWRLK